MPFEKVYSDTMFITYVNVALLNFINYYTRFSFIFIFKIAKQLNSKNSAKCLQKVIDYAKERNYDIDKIISDNGSEFYGDFTKLCNKYKIEQEYSRSGDKYKTAPIESFNRTIRSMFEKYRSVNNVNATNIFNIMREINKKYNNSYHSVLKSSPQEIMNGEKKNDSTTKNDVHYDLKKGDDVRVYTKDDLDPFNKLSPLWSKEIFKIDSRKKGYYKLDNGKLYRNNELQKINVDELMRKS
jgi:dipeptidyl aminopeptidase/acylaminoacyl peptidase